MITEIKLFMLTNHLMALYEGDWERTFKELEKLTKFRNQRYWEQWKERYKDILASQETLVILMRSAGYTYRTIQTVAKVSPGTIHDITKQYDLNYNELPETASIEHALNIIGERMEKVGHKLW